MNTTAWRVTLAAAALMALGMGLRAAGGLFVSPLNSVSGMGLATLSLLIACGQLAAGLAQPPLGALADRFGAARLVVAAALLLAAATAAPALWLSPTALGLALVVSAVAGTTVGSNALLVAEVNRHVSAQRAGFAVGLVGAGASLGPLLLGPATQGVIDGPGWQAGLLASAALALLALPLAALLRRPVTLPPPPSSQPVADVMRDARFWRVAGSLGMCGFHVAFLAVHMPGVIERCGLPASLAGPWMALAGATNIVGSLVIAGAMQRADSALLLVATYATRALGIAALLLLPPNTGVMLAFAVVMGASQMATLSPTVHLLARQHGAARLGSLIGVVMLVHQVGSFAGIWLGGWAAQATGSDRTLWLVDMGLALAAAALVWPQRLRARPATMVLQTSA